MTDTADKFENVGKLLRAFPWAFRADFVDSMLIESYLSMIHGEPPFNARDALLLLLPNYDRLMWAMDEPDIASADHATMLALLAPRRAADAEAWGAENEFVGEDLVAWLSGHPGHSLLFNLLNTAGPAPMVH